MNEATRFNLTVTVAATALLLAAVGSFVWLLGSQNGDYATVYSSADYSSYERQDYWVSYPVVE